MSMSISKSMHIAHILVKHEYEAHDIIRKLRPKGENFAELARKFSICPSAAEGGDLGEINLSRTVDEFADAASTLSAGETSGVVRTSFGYHLIHRID